MHALGAHAVSLDLVDGEAWYAPGFLSTAEADRVLDALRHETPWRADEIVIFGRAVPIPRLQAWYGNPEAIYTYSGLTLEPLPWTAELASLRDRVEAKSDGARFNSCLANLYRDGADSNGWHADDEPELGNDPVVGSLSFGATRRFRMKHKERQDLTVDLDLEHGSYLLMRGSTQHSWKHCLPKTKREVGPRVNLTFRLVV